RNTDSALRLEHDPSHPPDQEPHDPHPLSLHDALPIWNQNEREGRGFPPPTLSARNGAPTPSELGHPYSQREGSPCRSLPAGPPASPSRPPRAAPSWCWSARRVRRSAPRAATATGSTPSSSAATARPPPSAAPASWR